ncbi:MAG: YihY/virulence factor BrkB family protein [Eubacteriales bacterium]|nr:YihY/virulence factor BrkB family protein [Eubacteriales bacterium]
MLEFPKGGIIGKTVNAAIAIKELNIPLYAAYAGYFIILALFPSLLLILSLLRYTGLQVESLIELIDDFLPEALSETAEELVFSTYQNSSGAVVGLSAVTALWSASRGIYGLLKGLNAIYGVSENRGYVYTRGISVVYTFAFFLVLLLTLLLHVFGNSIIRLLTMVDNAVLIFLIDLIDLRFFLLLVMQSLIFTVMFMALPNKRNRFMDSLPGGVLSSIGWLVFSDIYSVYVENFSSYANIYGSVYAVALSMLWLYCCMSILFYGGALNRYLMERGT